MKEPPLCGWRLQTGLVDHGLGFSPVSDGVGLTCSGSAAGVERSTLDPDGATASVGLGGHLSLQLLPLLVSR